VGAKTEKNSESPSWKVRRGNNWSHASEHPEAPK
jgi:hypothetical protein